LALGEKGLKEVRTSERKRVIILIWFEMGEGVGCVEGATRERLE
jgi:hypothetical protein